MKIFKYQSLFQSFSYSKVYRLPGWLFQKLNHGNFDSTKKIVVKMRIGHKIELPTNLPYLKRVVWNRAYHDDSVFCIQPFLSQNCVIIDIGANIGLLTCAYAQRYNNLKPTIYAIEAIQRNYDLLLRNITINELSNVFPFRLAFGKEIGEISFSLPSEDYVGNAVGNNILDQADIEHLNQSNTYTEKVPLTTLQVWANENKLVRCDFIKIDIEGGELAVFRSGKEFILKTKPIIQCEFNKCFVEKQNLKIDDYISFFEPMGYKCFVEENKYFKPINPHNFNYEVVDMLFIPNNRL